MSEDIVVDVSKADLIVRELGYLKVPEKVRKTYGSPKRYPMPDADLVITEDEIRITYRFPKDEMDALKEV